MFDDIFNKNRKKFIKTLSLFENADGSKYN